LALSNGKVSSESPELKLLTNGFDDGPDKNGDLCLKLSQNGGTTNHDLILGSSPVISGLCIDGNNSELSPPSCMGISVTKNS